MIVRPVKQKDIEPVVEALMSAFSEDPLIGFLFGSDWQKSTHVREFFQILLDVRVTLSMPAFCSEEDGEVVGAVMGYDASRPTWPEGHAAKWSRLMKVAEGLESRLDAYGKLAEQFAPSQPHFYLGVIGVRIGRKGGGVGGALLGTFCEASAGNSESAGVFLETANEASLRFYLKNGFELRGQGVLGKSTRLWCVFKVTGQGVAV